MIDTPLDELNEAHKALLSLLQKCEKINIMKLGQSQQTLLNRRISALKIALNLIKKELVENNPDER